MPDILSWCPAEIKKPQFYIKKYIASDSKVQVNELLVVNCQ